MHIYGEAEETHLKEYQWKLWGRRFIHRPVGKRIRVTGSEPNLKCWRHHFHNDETQMIL